MQTLHAASRQWASRPDDERFVSLTDAQKAAHRYRFQSSAKVMPTKALEAVALDIDPTEVLQVKVGSNQMVPTHWAFGQLCSLVKAPASYLRTLPAALASDNVNYGLLQRDVEDVGVLFRNQEVDGGYQLIPTITALTGPSYGRVWNSEVFDALVARYGDGVTGDFRVPGIFGKRLDYITKRDTTIYLSDRDMFVFLADEEHRIEVPNRRDGQPGSLARGFFVRNSEVGACKLSVRTFLFDYVCCNRIVWGAQDVEEISIRHSSGAPRRFVEEVAPALEAYAQSSTTSITAALAKARAASIVAGADDKRAAVLDFLTKKRQFSRVRAEAVMLAHEEEEGRPIETLWDASVGVTAYARGIPWQDERVEMEREGGKILNLAA